MFFKIKNFIGVWQVSCLNFFVADLQAGIGPFLGIFLLAKGWQTSMIGTVMTLGGVAGMFMTAPAGALVDATTKKTGTFFIHKKPKRGNIKLYGYPLYHLLNQILRAVYRDGFAVYDVVISR